MQIAICDDNKDNLALMEDVIENIRIRDVEVDCFETGESLLDYLNKNPNIFYQIYLLDIEMPGVNGLEAAKKIRAIDQRAVIIFVTAYSDYVFSSFEVQPFRFVNKPIDTHKLEDVIQAAVNFIFIPVKNIYSFLLIKPKYSYAVRA